MRRLRSTLTLSARPGVRWLVWPFLALMLGLGATGLRAENNDDWQHRAEQRLPVLEKTVKAWPEGDLPTNAEVGSVYQEALDLRKKAEACEAELAAPLEASKKKLDTLGDAVEGESPDIKRVRGEFDKERKQIERNQGACRLIKLGAQELLNQVQQVRQQILSQALLLRDKPTWAVLPILIGVKPMAAPERSLELGRVRLGATTGLGLLILLPLSFGLRRWLRRRFPARRHPVAIEAPESQVAPAVATAPAPGRRFILARMYGNRAVWLAAAGALVLGLHHAGGTPLAYPIVAVMLALVLAPLLQLLVCRNEWRCPEGAPARTLLGLALVGVAAVLAKVDLYVPPSIYLALRGLFVVVLALAALWLLFALSRRENWPTLASIRLPLAIGLISGPVAEWLGYRGLADLLILGIYGTVTGALIAWLLWEVTGGALASLQNPATDSGKRVREVLGYPPEAELGWITLSRWMIALGLLAAYGYWLLEVWQTSPADTGAMREFWTSGFQAGAITIVPSRLIGAVVAFILVTTIARWLKRQMGERWLVRTNLDAGARQSIVSLTSYVIVGAAILLALSMAGLEFQNLAIIAGALSVGIGFGLQNIVNNFVSGLILLFERPVRPGDWIVVGSTEGYVRKISIRSTQIQTFDRADVLVPNSELISNQVTNWMLQDPFGRVIVPVGVAYGSDTRKVRDILFKVAKEHPLVMSNDARVPTPKVFFISFGDSSLNFELRCMIKQVDYRLSVRSDLLFAIDDAFRAAGIEVPFPQRVVHTLVEPAPNKSPTGSSDQP